MTSTPAALFKTAQAHAQAACFPQMLAVCRQIAADYPENHHVLLDVGALLLSFGFLTRARIWFEHANQLAPNDLRASVNLAREAGAHTESPVCIACQTIR
ncbi:MAG: hypothetical protein ACOH2B_12185 [Burkholderiaceae bacterium]